ncbi:MAG: hypothetical protein JXC36_07425 [Candidatus Atribacteria bacterium]|nr:hypothetical protein [Candidatus Atribacteria bacterium]
MNKISIIIAKNELDEDHLPWVNACKAINQKIDFLLVDITKDNWFDRIISTPCDLILTKPSGLTSHFKQLYDERIYILDKLGYKLYPSAEEIFIYENKRFLSFWLKAHDVPHPATHVFYSKHEAEDFLKTTGYPVVAKVNIGASGSGVTILKSKDTALEYIHNVFSGRGAIQRSGPNLGKGGLIRRGFHYILYPGDIRKKLLIYKTKRSNLQKGFVILQEYIPHDFEWRVVRIGESFFAHKKLKKGEKTSGSLIKGYENPPLKLLDFVREITNKHKFYSQAVDIFEDKQRGYLVNEMQCIFGQSDPYQMLVDGKPGRYKWLYNKWVFEAGDFARNACYDLRLDYIISEVFNNKL